jgi:hypothetical protein
MSLGVAAVASLLSSLLLATPSAQTYSDAENFQINDHVAYEAGKTPDGGLHVRFQFKDHTGALLVFEHTYDYQRTLEMIARFGLPGNFLRPYPASEAPNRRKLLDNGMFQLRGDTIRADLSAVTTFYSDEFAKPIADFIFTSLRQRGLDSRTARIAMAMAFVQDIPYGIPTLHDGVFRGGVSPAPLILLSGFGDCDSKATLFVGILRHLIPPEDILFLYQHGQPHLLTAIQDVAAPGRSTLNHEGRLFVLADTAGPGRLDFGEVSPEDRGMSVIVVPYENRTLPFHEDADYSTFGRVSFHPREDRVSFRGAKSQVASPVHVSDTPKADERQEMPIASGEEELEGDEEAAGETAVLGGGGASNVVVRGGSVTVGGLNIRYGGGSVRVSSNGENGTVSLNCGESLTVRSNGVSSYIQVNCGDSSEE